MEIHTPQQQRTRKNTHTEQQRGAPYRGQGYLGRSVARPSSIIHHTTSIIHDTLSCHFHVVHTIADRNAELTLELSYYRQQVTNMQSASTPYKIPLYVQSEHIQTEHLQTAKNAMKNVTSSSHLSSPSPSSPRKPDHAISLATQLHHAKCELEEWKTRCTQLASRACTCVCVNGCEQRLARNGMTSNASQDTFVHPTQPINPYGPLLTPISPTSLHTPESLLSWGASSPSPSSPARRIPLTTYNSMLYGTGPSHAPHVQIITTGHDPSNASKEKKKTKAIMEKTSPDIVTALEKEQIKEMGRLN